MNKNPKGFRNIHEQDYCENCVYCSETGFDGQGRTYGCLRTRNELEVIPGITTCDEIDLDGPVEQNETVKLYFSQADIEDMYSRMHKEENQLFQCWFPRIEGKHEIMTVEIHIGDDPKEN